MTRNTKVLVTSLTFLLFCTAGLMAQQKQSWEVETIDSFDNLYRYGEYYIAGQPSLEAFQWLREEGVTRVINLRTHDENEEFTSSSFDEKSIVSGLGMEYLSVPVAGRSGYTPKKLSEVAEFIREGEKVLIHCGGAGRATNFLMAYLVKYRGYTLDDAVDVGQDLTYYLPLEDLLDIEITMKEK
jgi:protein tyrosine phosphatase (PTP) superfamily phosphohydrolase (DUF442 family)